MNDTIPNIIIDYSENLKLIQTELEWILNIINRDKPKSKDILAEEMLGRFFSLYEDFKLWRFNLEKLLKKLNSKNEIHPVDISYITAIQVLMKKSVEGIFSEFINVAESGKLPHNN